MRHFSLSILALSLLLTACGNNTAPQTQNTAQDNANSATTQPATTNEPATAATAQPSDTISLKITGAGASFPQPIYAKWSADFNSATGGQVNYQSIGSSGGIKQIIAKTVDFGATDAPLSAEELTKEGLIQFPTVIGGVVPVVNIDGVSAGQLKLDGESLADIYLGKITKWNDPKIVALNPDIALPDASITTVFRSDGSGTTFNFTDYLAKVSPVFKSSVGVDKSVNWPTQSSGAGGKGNDGVASYVGRMKNSIGYVEYAFAKQNNMAHVSLKNAAGEFVQPSADSFAKAGAIDWNQVAGFNQILTNSNTQGAWPIASATFILVHKNPANPEQVKGVLQFFDWAYKNGDDAAKALDYVPFNEESKALFIKSFDEVKDASGQAVFK